MPVNQRVLVQFHYNLVTTNRFTIDGWIYFQCNAGRNRTTVGWCDKWHCLDFIPVSVFAQVTHRMMNLPLYTRFAPTLSVSAVAWKSHTASVCSLLADNDCSGIACDWAISLLSSCAGCKQTSITSA